MSNYINPCDLPGLKGFQETIKQINHYYRENLAPDFDGIATALTIPGIEALNSVTENINISFVSAALPIIEQMQPISAAFSEPFKEYIAAINNTLSITAPFGDSLSAIRQAFSISEELRNTLHSIDFSEFLSNVTIQDEYVELNENAIETLSSFVDITPEKEPEISPIAETVADIPAPVKSKLTRGELIGILLTILFGLLPLIQNEIHHAQDSLDQQQQWQIENEQREELISQANAIVDYLKQLTANPEESLVYPLPSAAESQKVPEALDSAPTSDDSNP